MNLDKSLKYAKKLLESYSHFHEFAEYSRSYLFTTEYINRYLRENSFNKDKALTILGSGDQIFNLVYLDVFNIDAFDINKLNYYNFYLKYAFILNLSFKEFKSLEHIISKDQYLPIFMNYLELCKNSMPFYVYRYYKELVYYEYSLNKSNGLRNLYLPSHTFFSSNLYLENENNYLKLQQKLKELKLRIYFDDISNIPKLVDGNYDLIILSNISDYLGSDKPLTLEEFKNYINTFKELLKKDGLLINYLYGLRSKFVIQNSTVRLEDLEINNVVKFWGNEGYLRIRKKM